MPSTIDADTVTGRIDVGTDRPVAPTAHGGGAMGMSRMAPLLAPTQISSAAPAAKPLIEDMFHQAYTRSNG